MDFGDNELNGMDISITAVTSRFSQASIGTGFDNLPGTSCVNVQLNYLGTSLTCQVI